MGTARRSILVVEDSVGIRDAVRGLLELEGYTVEVAAHGDEALEKLRKMRAPCLILLDLMMPGMDGWTFEAIREKDVLLAPIPLVVMSGAPHIDSPAQPGEVLKKPIDLKQLKSLVASYCGC